MISDVFGLFWAYSRLNFVLFCLTTLLQVPKCFGLVIIFGARPKIHLHIVAVTNTVPNKKMICIQQNGFFAVTKVFNEAVNFFGWLKKIGPAQNILGPV